MTLLGGRQCPQTSPTLPTDHKWGLYSESPLPSRLLLNSNVILLDHFSAARAGMSSPWEAYSLAPGSQPHAPARAGADLTFWWLGFGTSSQRGAGLRL
jgi:hypothetical protein